MKNLKKLLALLLALLMCASALSLAETAEEAAVEETSAADDPVLFTFDGEEFSLSSVTSYLDYLLNNNYVDSANDYDSAINYIVTSLTITKKIEELGLDQFTDEEKAAFMEEAQIEWGQALQDYVDYFKTGEEDEEALKAQAEAYYAAYGYSVESLAESLMQDASYDLLQELIVEGKDLSITEEEIRAVYDEWVEEDRAMYANDIFSYELYQNYYGYTVAYMPDGYRGIIHILLKTDDSLLTALTSAQAAYEESQNEDQPDGDPALLEKVNEARSAVIASKQDVIDDIYARLQNGESFQSLIAEYGEDLGMTDPVQLEEGYAVHRDSIIWDSVFTDAAFSEKMQQPGDVSDPVVGSYGIHILYYLRDIPGGPMEMTDEISQTIEEYLNSQKLNACYADTLDAWTAEHEIIYNQEAIDAAKAGN